MSLAAHSTQNMTLGLAAFAQLAFADGDLERAALLAGTVEGLRQRAGLAGVASGSAGKRLIWPPKSARTLGADRFDQAYAAGARLNRRDAVAAARDTAPAPGRPEP